MKFKHIDTCWYFNKLDHRGKPYEWPCCGEITECDEAFVNSLKAENARLRKALEWMVNNQHLTIMIENPDHVEHFMSRAHAALEGKE